MLLTISTTHSPATDLGHLLRKNPARVQSFALSFGQAHVFYPEATDERCTVALLLEIDPVGLVRGRRGPAGDGGALDQYVNDRPYVASSFMSVALAEVFGSALAGRSKDRPELVETLLPLTATLAMLPCRGGEAYLRLLFEPLGYQLEVVSYPLDPMFPEWGQSRFYTVTLHGQVTLQALLSHLYVLVPVLDDEKHYWVGDDEVNKLLRHGGAWLAAHPARETIARRYLKHRRHLLKDALRQLAPEADQDEAVHAAEEAQVEKSLSLNEQRIQAVVSALQATNAKRVLDLGCGEAQLVRELLKSSWAEEITGMDVSYRSLEIAQDRLGLERMPEKQRKRVTLLHGSLMYRDKRLNGFDAAAVVEVVEHLDPPRLRAFERVLFQHARPGTVIVTTPNAEYNSHWPALPAGKFRHRDHRFEWTRQEFQQWADNVASRFGYATSFLPVGPVDEQTGPPTQMAIFSRASTASP